MWGQHLVTCATTRVGQLLMKIQTDLLAGREAGGARPSGK